jgi:hypothetical protein
MRAVVGSGEAAVIEASRVSAHDARTGVSIFRWEIATLAIAAYYGLYFFIAGGPPLYMHLASGALVAAATVRLALRPVVPRGWWLPALLLPTLLLTVVTREVHGVLLVGSYAAILASYLVLSDGMPWRPVMVYWILLVVVVPSFIASSIIGRSIIPVEEGFMNPPRLLPDLSDPLIRVNIGPYGSTSHYSGLLGVLVVSAALMRLRRRLTPLDLAMLSLGAYLTIASRARVALLTMVCIGVLVTINWRRFHRLLSFIVVIGFTTSVYATALLEAGLVSSDNAVTQFFRIGSEEADFSNGRAWLWAYHLSYFADAPLTGAGLDAIDLTIGERLGTGEVVQAGSESFYTAMLAAFGIAGLMFPLLHLALLVVALARRDLTLTVLAAIVLVQTTAASGFGVLYGLGQSVVLMWLCNRLTRASVDE